MRILVVDDEPRMARSVSQALTEAAHAIDTAFDGARALELALSTPYDAMVLDLMLPAVDGFTVCRRLRDARRATPILVISARDLVEDRVQALDAGADDYLVKPFAMAELLARVRALLRRHEQVTPPVLIAGSLTLDPVSRIVRQGCRPVALTQREFALLACLMRRPGVVFTRSMIAERIWDYQFDQASNVIDVYVAQLRRKIDLPNRPSFIQTVRGAGYVLLDPDVASA